MKKIIIGLIVVIVAVVIWMCGRTSVGISDLVGSIPMEFDSGGTPGDQWISISGSWTVDENGPVPAKAAHSTQIYCHQIDMTCDEYRAVVLQLQDNGQYYPMVRPYHFGITAWSGSSLEAAGGGDGPESDYVLKIDLKNQSALLTMRESIWNVSTSQTDTVEHSYTLK